MGESVRSLAGQTPPRGNRRPRTGGRNPSGAYTGDIAVWDTGHRFLSTTIQQLSTLRNIILMRILASSVRIHGSPTRQVIRAKRLVAQKTVVLHTKKAIAQPSCQGATRPEARVSVNSTPAAARDVPAAQSDCSTPILATLISAIERRSRGAGDGRANGIRAERFPSADCPSWQGRVVSTAMIGPRAAAFRATIARLQLP
jgi:hypothetical protein